MTFTRSIALPVVAAALLVQGCATPKKAALPAPAQLYVGPPAHPVAPVAAKTPRPRPPLMQPSVPHEESAPNAAPVDTVTAEPAPAEPTPAAPDDSALATPGAAPPAEAAPAPTAPPAPAPAPVAPATLVGLSEDEVRARLGAPAAIADSGPAQTWTYRAGGCSLDIAFFFDVTRNGFYALSESARVADGGQPTCLARVAAAHAS